MCFTHVPQNKRDKLDKRASPGIFISYSTVTKAYKIFQPQTGSIVVSRDVHFVEDEEWNWDEVKKKDQTVADLQLNSLASRTEEEEDWQSELRERIEINSGKSMLSFDELQSIYNLQLYYLHVNKF